MRLIDADKIVYSWQQDRNGKFHDGVTLESIIDNIPTENVNDLIVKELEKTKAKIEQMDFDFGDYYDNTDIIIEMVSKVIDKRIAELKGD